MNNISLSPYDVIKASYDMQLGHIPSALSILPIVNAIHDIDLPDIVIGKSFGMQAWFGIHGVRDNVEKGERILNPRHFKDSNFRVVYCAEQLGTAAGYAAGYSIGKNVPVVCFLSDADAIMESTQSSIRFAFEKDLRVTYIIDCNSVQLFNEKSCLPFYDYITPFSIHMSTFKRLIRARNFNSESQRFCLYIVETKKGDGCPNLYKVAKKWHYTILDKEKFEFLTKDMMK